MFIKDVTEKGGKLSRMLHEEGKQSRNMPSNQIRPRTSELLELHVFYVPEEVWDFQLNTVPVDVISKFFSAGFIRVSPHMTLRTLREQLGEYLGEDVVVDKFIFLKCIGKKLAVVKPKQETELKLKSFAPPYAFHPELYLLPGVESIYLSSSSTPEKDHDNAEYVLSHISCHGPDSLAVPTLKGRHNPPVLGTSLKNHLSQDQTHDNFLGWNETEKAGVPGLHIQTSTEQEKNERVQGKYSSQRKKGEIRSNTSQIESSTSPYTVNNLIPEKQNSVKMSRPMKMHQRISLSQAQEMHNTTRKREKSKELISSTRVNHNHGQEENNQTEVNNIPQKIRETSLILDATTENGSSLIGTGRHTTGDSGIPESFEDRDLEYLQSEKSQQHPGITKSVADTSSVQDNQTDRDNPSDFARQNQYISPPAPPLLALSVSRIHIPNRVFPTEGSELNRQLHLTKRERKDLEKTRVELIKKVKGLLEQNKLRRCQARDYWKKKYFEVKKVTVSLEEILNKLREDFELHYHKLLMQLEARDIRKKHNNLTCFIKSKNNTIIQITTLQHDIDQLRRKLDNAKMKLVIEIKMRKQATSDLRALKAELEHKKVQSLKLQSEKHVSQLTSI